MSTARVICVVCVGRLVSYKGEEQGKFPTCATRFTPVGWVGWVWVWLRWFCFGWVQKNCKNSWGAGVGLGWRGL